MNVKIQFYHISLGFIIKGAYKSRSKLGPEPLKEAKTGLATH